ncbi:ribonucleoside-diphosphate reductase_gp266 [Bacillus phage vB_BceM_WH1]|nr:ribonucleoside-diphosphate reductase_gp266 [Bacillus phage vB_BceM_WH1]
MNHLELNNEVVTTEKEGFYNLEKDIEARDELLKEIEQKTKKFSSEQKRYEYLIRHRYYKDIRDLYTWQQIEDIHQYLYSFGFEFQSYMATSKFFKDYVLRTNDKKQYLENYEQHVAIVALTLAKGNFIKALSYAKVMVQQDYQPATPTFLNTGRERGGEQISCFLLSCGDSLNDINHMLSTAFQLSKIGGGVAIDLTNLRARGEVIKEIENAASGVVPVMKLLEDGFAYVNQLGQRAGACAVYLNIFHWDVEEFLATKRIAGDEKSRLQTLSIGLIADDIFFKLAKEDKDMYVFAPYTVEKEYGVPFSSINMDEMYDELVANPNIKKRKLELSARDMLVKIATVQLESGYPYFMYKTNANEGHALKHIGPVKMSNLCTEIFQAQTESSIGNYGKKDDIGYDVNCTLGSLNIVNVMENKSFQNAVHNAIEMLSTISEDADISNAPSVQKAKDDLHAVGLGAMNLHGFLAKNKIHYESEEAIDFVSTFFMMLNYYSLEKSMELAKEKGAFHGFGGSDYGTGVYFDRYLSKSYEPKTEKVKALFDGIEVPGIDEWIQLKAQVMEHGLYNAYRLAVAPTQSISYVQNATSSIMPVVSQIEQRTYANATTVYPMPFLSKETYWYYKSAYDMDMMKLIDLVAAAQEHVDQGISCTLYVNSDIPTNTLGRYYAYANKKGLKSLYYTRIKKQSVEDGSLECISCSV